MEMNRAKKPTTTSFRLKYLPTDFYHLSTTPCAFFGGYLSVDTFGSFFFSWDTTNLSMGVGGRYYYWCLFFATLFSTASFIHFQGCCSVHMTHMPSITTCEKGI